MSIPDNDHVSDSSTRADTPEEVRASVIEAPAVTHVDELDAARLDAATERAKSTALAFRLMMTDPNFLAVRKAAEDAEQARIRMECETKARYGLLPADTIDTATGAITRAPTAN